MKEDILIYSPIVIFRGTPCTSSSKTKQFFKSFGNYFFFVISIYEVVISVCRSDNKSWNRFALMLIREISLALTFKIEWVYLLEKTPGKAGFQASLNIKKQLILLVCPILHTFTDLPHILTENSVAPRTSS